MKSTKNFNLTLFEASDVVNVEDINKNTQQIDAVLTSISKGYKKLKTVTMGLSSALAIAILMLVFLFTTH